MLKPSEGVKTKRQITRFLTDFCTISLPTGLSLYGLTRDFTHQKTTFCLAIALSHTTFAPTYFDEENISTL